MIVMVLVFECFIINLVFGFLEDGLIFVVFYFINFFIYKDNLVIVGYLMVIVLGKLVFS